MFEFFQQRILLKHLIRLFPGPLQKRQVFNEITDFNLRKSMLTPSSIF